MPAATGKKAQKGTIAFEETLRVLVIDSILPAFDN
jgi:hypothetical protein